MDLEELMQADLSSMTFADISSSVRSAMNKVAILAGLHFPPFIFLRMRAGSALAEQRKDLSYNPNAESVGWGRCNGPGEPIFYASNSPEGLPQEIHAIVGDTLSLGYWRSRVPLLLSAFGFSENVRRRMGTVLHFPASEPEPDSTSLNSSTMKAYQFLMDAFTETVGPNEEHKYMTTTAIYRILNGDVGPVVIEGVSKERFDGVRFPSIAARGNLVNFALPPQAVDSSLELFRVEAFKVTGIEDTKYNLWAIATGYPAVDGTIQWGEFEHEFKVELSLSTAIVSHGKPGFRIRTPDGGVAAGF